MKIPLALLCASLLAATVPSQITSADFAVAETAGLTLVDPLNSKSRPVQNAPRGAFTKVALNPLNAGEFWGVSSGPRLCSSLGSALDYFTISGDGITSSLLRCNNVAGTINRMHTFRDALLFSLTGPASGIYTRARGATTSTQIAGGNANHLAVLGEKIYFSTTDTPNAIVEVDMTGTPPKVTTLKLVLDPNAPTGSALPTTISAMCANGPEPGATTLAVFDQKGILYVVTPGAAATTHNVTTNNVSGIATPIDAVYHPRVPLNLLIATSTAVYDAIQFIVTTGTPIYASQGTIQDIDYSAGGVAFYGQGCKGSNGKSPTVAFGGLPYQGNTTFALRMQQGKPSSLAFLAIGLSNTTWNANKLPLDLGLVGATGCDLLASIDVLLSAATDGNGDIGLVTQVPIDSKIVGTNVFVQFAVADAVNAAGFVTSNAMQLVIR